MRPIALLLAAALSSGCITTSNPIKGFNWDVVEGDHPDTDQQWDLSGETDAPSVCWHIVGCVPGWVRLYEADDLSWNSPSYEIGAVVGQNHVLTFDSGCRDAPFALIGHTYWEQDPAWFQIGTVYPGDELVYDPTLPFSGYLWYVYSEFDEEPIVPTPNCGPWAATAQ